MQINLLSALRFLTVFFISLLFLQLAIQRIKHSKLKKELIIGIDNSQSIKAFGSQVSALKEQLESELKSFAPDILLFDSHTRKSDSLSFAGKRSNYSGLIDAVNKNYVPDNVGAVVLIGDGIVNAGIDPVYDSNKATYPIFTVGIGDTTVHTDAAIRKVDVNKTVYLENNFPVQIDLSFLKASGSIVNLTISHNQQVVYSKAIQVQNDNYFFTENLSLKAKSAGIQKYVVHLDQINGETNLVNNTYEFSVNVVSEKQKILILTHSPHPDIGALTEAINEKPNYEFKIETSKEDLDLTLYNLVILHQLPDGTAASNTVIEKLKESHKPYWCILGKKTSLTDLNTLKLGVQIKLNNSFENVKAKVNNQFNLFRFDQVSANELESLPPLLAPFGDVTLNPMLDVFASQSIQSIETQRPLIAFGKLNGVRCGFILGEGIWRWRIHSYLLNHSHEQFNDFILKSINYLILKSNEDNFNVFHKTAYDEDASVIMQAELFNDSYELDNSPDVELELNDENGKKYNALFDKTSNKYQLDLGQLPVGKYSFTAHTRLGDKDYSETGDFSVNKIQNELVKTEANFQTLHQIASKTGGQFFLHDQVEALIKELKDHPSLQTKEISQQIYQEFISMKWIFFLILFLLALEWFLRKFWGTY